MKQLFYLFSVLSILLPGLGVYLVLTDGKTVDLIILGMMELINIGAARIAYVQYKQDERVH